MTNRLMPSSVVQNFQFTHSIVDEKYSPVNGDVLTVALRGPATVDITANANASAFDITGNITTAGRYQYTVIATDINSNRFIMDSGTLQVETDPTQIADGTALTTHAERVLAAIEAVIEGRASKDQQSYSIAGRSLSKTPLNELLMLRDKYKTEVQQAQKKLPRRVLPVFRNP